ncbi:MAG TPA: DUF4058 family protein [Isosphaeraceae bacterium]|nr:DUF4058 family protein [Isosphaeraceae bacterium]
MPIHGWTRVHAGTFHHFHHSWIEEIARALNRGLLPRSYYAMSEQITGGLGPDGLTLNLPVQGSLAAESAPDGIALAAAPPKVRFRARGQIDIYARKAKAVVIHHRSGHRVIAMVELVSPGTKGSQTELSTFVQKAEQALRGGVHLLVVDLFPPTPRDPRGIHRAIWGRDCEGDFALPDDKPLTCVSYVGFPIPEVFLEPVAVGDALPDRPLFLTPEVDVPVPLEATYRSAWEALPEVWREVLTAPPANGRKKPGRGRKRKE